MTWTVNECSLRRDADDMIFSYVELETLSGESTTFNSKSYKSPVHAFNAAQTWAVLFSKQLCKVTLYDPSIWNDAMARAGIEAEFRDEEFEGEREKQKLEEKNRDK